MTLKLLQRKWFYPHISKGTIVHDIVLPENHTTRLEMCVDCLTPSQCSFFADSGSFSSVFFWGAFVKKVRKYSIAL
jgi:hypothetical protein